MTKINRKYISIYFKDLPLGKRKKRDLTVVFNPNSLLYKKCRSLGSTKIKKIIESLTYRQLVEKAKKEGRSLGNYIKYRLSKKLKINE